jgi:hypothetical protein
MGTAFPARSVVKSVNPTTRGDEPAIEVVFDVYPKGAGPNFKFTDYTLDEFHAKYVAPYLPTAADLDAVAEEQRVKEETEWTRMTDLITARHGVENAPRLNLNYANLFRR